MRKLTFAGFTKRYVKSLSLSGTTAIYPLVQEAEKQNPRLREPLFLYALSNRKEKTLLIAAKNSSCLKGYQDLLNKYGNSSKLLEAIKDQSPDIPIEYQKVWTSYLAVARKLERDREVKELMRARISAIQKEKSISTYRMSKDLGLNNANVNSWLKNGEPNKVSLDSARKILSHLEDQ